MARVVDLHLVRSPSWFQDAEPTTTATDSSEAGAPKQGNGGNMTDDFTLVPPVKRGDSFVFQLGPVELSVDPALGARITRFAYGGENVLTEPAVHEANWGSTFWTSPQAAWGWPPVATIDSGPYTGSVDNNHVLTLTSQPAELSDSQVTVTKRFAPVPSRGAVDVTYVITNVGSTSIDVAPWEISRVSTGGITFFAKGPGGITSDKLSLSEVGPVIWYASDFSVSGPRGDQKAFADGLGWVAHVAGDLLMVKQYPDVAPGAAAPGEAEVELYTGPWPYVEIEPQGAYQALTPGASLSWTVRWSLRKLPSHVIPAVGSATLIGLAKQQMG